MGNCYMKRYHTKRLFCGHYFVTRKKDYTNSTANLWTFVTEKEITLRTLLFYGHLLAWKQTTLTKFAFYGHCLYEKKDHTQKTAII